MKTNLNQYLLSFASLLNHNVAYRFEHYSLEFVLDFVFRVLCFEFRASNLSSINDHVLPLLYPDQP